MPTPTAATGDAPRTAQIAEAIFGNRLPVARRYAELLATVGMERGLLGPREVPRLWERHLLNCAALTEMLPANARIVDVGSGAGLPGLVLAIRRPDLRVDLVESLQRRVDFLSETVDELGLVEQVRVVHGRAESKDVLAAVRESAWVTARAVAPLDRLVKWCLPLLAPGGHLLAIKGASAEDELREHAPAIRRLGGRSMRVVTCGVELQHRIAVVTVGRAARRTKGAS